MSQEKFAERMHITGQAIRHEEADRIPIWCQYGSTPFVLSGGAVTYRDSMYDFEKASEAIIAFHRDFQPDAQLANMVSGKVEEIAETAVLDWPGRPGTKVPDECVYQVLEPELMAEDEYDELFSDFTGFMLHKYIPRAFPGLAGLGKVLNPAPTGYMYFGQMANSLFNPDAVAAYEKLIEISKVSAECQAAIKKTQGTLFGMGFPPLMTGVGMVPYDTLSNYFRHTIDTFEDLMFQEENVERAVNFFADLQIRNLQYFRFVDMPVKRVMFWMHKGMDGFMNPEQFEKYYWTPFLKVINALVDMGVTPVIYTEGAYETRLEQIVGLPAGKCVVHFENVDLQHAKDTVGKESCITANFPIYLLEYGTKQQVVDEVKRQIDIGAPGGGFIWETNASIQVVKRENLEAMYDTVREYGRK